MNSIISKLAQLGPCYRQNPSNGWPNIGANEPKLQEERPNMAPTCFQDSPSLHQDGSSTAQIGPNIAPSDPKLARI